MSLKLVYMALDSGLYPKHDKTFRLFLSLCNFSDEQGKGWAATKTLTKHCGGCSPQHVRTMKKRLEKDGLVTFNPGRGRGNQTTHKINVELLQMQTSKGASTGSLFGDTKGQPETSKRATVEPKKGNSRGATIGKKDIKRSAREARAHNFGAASGHVKGSRPPWLGEHDIGPQAPVIRARFETLHGAEAARAWFDRCRIDASNPDSPRFEFAQAFQGKTFLNRFENFVLGTGGTCVWA